MPGRSQPRGGGTERTWDLKDIEELIDVLIQREITEFEMEKDGLRIRIKRGDSHAEPVASAGFSAPNPLPPSAPVAAPVVAVLHSSPAGAEPPPAESSEGLYLIKSPIVGTFYAAPGPNAPPFVKLGDVVQVGQILGIIEAMKLMNEIESEVAGEIVRIYIENGQPVEYGQSLFAINPSHKK